MTIPYLLPFKTLKQILFLVVVFSLFQGISPGAYAQNVTPATGGTDISADSVGGTYTHLTTIVIDETSTGQISSGELSFDLPSGFMWDTSRTPTVQIDAATGFSGKGTNLDIEFTSISPSQITFNVTSSSDGPPNKPGKATFDVLYVRPTRATLPNNGTISGSGPALSGVGDNYGDLKMVPGAATDVFVENADDGSGSTVSAQDLAAGNSITVHAIVRDQHGNFIRNTTTDSWNLLNKSVLSASPLNSSGGTKNVTFSSDITGSAQIEATDGSLTTNPSETITVIADSPDHLAITTQPSTSATAGTQFSQQPVVEIQDQYSNVIARDNATTISVARNKGEGTLQGTTSKQVSSGVATFTDLSHRVANTINLSFSGGNLPSVTSNDITITPASADSLMFAVQPSNGSPNTPITPTVEVQVVDTFGNAVAIQGVTVDLQKNSGSGNIKNGSETTNSNGIASFAGLEFSQTDSYTITAVDGDQTSPPDLSNSALSNSFNIVQSGQLAKFIIEDAGTTSGTVSDQNADPASTFDIKIRAVDGEGSLLDGQQGRNLYDKSVTISSTGNLIQGSGETAEFTNGVLSSHTMNINNTGDFTITADESGGDISSTSNTFTVIPGPPVAGNSTFSTDTDTITADGSSTATLSVQLKDEAGNALDSGGDDVAIQFASTDLNNAGSLSDTTDNNDGTYTATVTAPTDTATDTLSATVNGNQIGTVTVTYWHGQLATFTVEENDADGGNIPTQTAGSPFNVKITAKDNWNNTVLTFDGTVEVSSAATFNSGDGTTNAFTDGELTDHSVELTSAGDYRLQARRTSFNESGTSNLFTVQPAAVEPGNSTISTSDEFLENDGTDQATITVQLIDSFGNDLTSGGNNVSLGFTGSPSASLSAVSDNGDGTYTATVTSSSTKETVTIEGSVDGTPLNDNVSITITNFNTWTSKSGGNRSDKRTWELADNWNQGAIPATGEVIEVPTTPANADFYPIIQSSPTIDFLTVATSATTNLDPGFTLTMNEDMTGEGTFICDRATVISKGDITINKFAASTCSITLNGTTEQTITAELLSGDLTIDNDVTVTGLVNNVDTLTVTDGNTMTVESGGTLEILGEINLEGSGNLVLQDATFEFSSDSVDGSDFSVSNINGIFNGSNAQCVQNLTNFDNLTIDNVNGVTFKSDVVVQDTLFLNNGIMTMASGTNLIADIKSGNTSNLRFLRDLGLGQSWIMLSSPISSTYGDFLDSVITQGYPNAQYTSSQSDSLQPNVLYYEETASGTDNQRWRAPNDHGNSLTEGRGLFVYVFGSIASDNRYNQSTPRTLTVQGTEFDGDGTAVDFGVTYTESSDTSSFKRGWNLVGNPFGATIDWDDGNWTKTNMNNAIYIWDPTANSGNGAYLDWNGFDGTLGDGLIAPFQGFWVKADTSTPTLKVQKDSKTTGGDFKPKQQEQVPSIAFKVNGDSLSDTMHFTFSEAGRMGVDRHDAYRLLPFQNRNYAGVYSELDNGTHLSINNLPLKFGKPLKVPLHVEFTMNGGPSEDLESTLTWTKLRNIPRDWSLSLNDRRQKKQINLKRNENYTFTVKHKRQKNRARQADTLQYGVNSRTQLATVQSGSDDARFSLTIDPGDHTGLPDKFALHDNYPNPFNPETTIPYEVPIESRVRIEVYNILGQRVARLLNERKQAGRHTLNYDFSGLSSGVYIYRMQAGDKQFTKKMLLLK